jgi:uncharacterized protein YgiM (DUF1202 family)
MHQIVIGALLALLQFGAASVASGAEDYEVVVADPFLELHSGPGRGYPVFYVIDRGTTVSVLKRRTDWFKVRGDRGTEGWVSRQQMLATLGLKGDPVDLREPSREDFATRRWEAGVMAGDFGGASVISVYGAYAFSDSLSVELTGSQVLGNFSNGLLGTLSLVHVFVPEWRVSPYFTLGTGMIVSKPRTTLVQSEDRTDQIAHVGVGLRGYLSRRFLARIEYRSNVVFTSRDDNEEVDEWKAGFAFFF